MVLAIAVLNDVGQHLIEPGRCPWLGDVVRSKLALEPSDLRLDECERANELLLLGRGVRDVLVVARTFLEHSGGSTICTQVLRTNGDYFSNWTPRLLTGVDEAYEPLDRIEDLLSEERNKTRELFAVLGARLVVSQF